MKSITEKTKSGASPREIRLTNRHVLEQMVHRLEFVEGRDRELLRLYLESGVSIRQIATLLGISEARVSRRIKGLMRRLCSEEFELLMICRTSLSSEQFTLAGRYYIQGISTRKLAALYRTTRHNVRSRLERIQHIMSEKKNALTQRYCRNSEIEETAGL